MVRTVSLLVLLIVAIAMIPLRAAPIPLHAQEGAAFVLETTLLASNTKYPQLAVDANGVYVSAVDGIPDNGTTKLWIKGEEAPVFPAPLVLGTVTAGSAQDWYQTAVTTAPTGEVYVLWIDQGAKTIKFRRREPSGVWNPTTFEIMRGHIFAVEPALAVRTNGQIVAAWRDDKNIRFAFSNDRGATWSAVGTITAVQAYKSQTALAAGPNGELAITFTRDTPRPLHVMVALWNGTSFNPPVDVNGSTSAVFADASVSFSPDPAPNTRIAVAFRGADDGIFFAEKLVSDFGGPWSAVQLINGKGDGRVSIDYDQLRNLHITWIRQGANGNRNANQLFYAVRPAGQGFLPVVSAPTVAPVFNAWGDARFGARSYMHVAHEFFQGTVPRPRYALFRAPGAMFGSRPVIENDAVVVGGEGKVTLNVTFPDITPAALPNQVRWRWGAPPTDTENDSGGWQPFNPTGPTSVLTVPIPEAFRTDAGCVERELFTQLRNTVNNLTDQPRSDKVVIDTAVVGSVVVGNPFSRLKTSPFTAATLADVLADGGASDGHPDHTRVPAAFVEIRNLGDCSGLHRFALAPSSATLSSVANLAISGGRFANILPYPGAITEGPMPVVIRVRDALGNPMTIERTLIYDATPPVLNGGTLQAQAIDGGPSIVVNLQFTSLSVTDNLYPGRGFWGVWLANSRTPVANPAADPTLVWVPVEVPGTSNSFTVVWSLFSGLPSSQRTPGTYYVYARVLDGAGNPSAAVLPVATISIDQVTLPQVLLPIVLR